MLKKVDMFCHFLEKKLVVCYHNEYRCIMKLKMIVAVLYIFFYSGCSRQYDDKLRIYFVEGPPPMKLCSIDINGNNRQVLREFPGYSAGSPGITASTDGEYIAVSLYNTTSSAFDLILMKTDGSGMKLLYNSSSGLDLLPSFTYTDNEIAFRDAADLKFINTKGVITASYPASAGAFTPLRPFCLTNDRDRIITAVQQGPTTKIFMGDLLNNVAYQVNSADNPTYITFDPLDNDIYFLISFSLYTVKLPTSFPATVSGLPAPLASGLTSVSLSADGEYITATNTGYTSLMLYDSNGNLVRTLTTGTNVYVSCFECRPR